MYIVSDEILERLLCSECKKYLSVKPVKVYPNRSTRCGRCSNPFDIGVNSLFGILAEDALFRCINRYDGCSQLLTYSEVAGHEKLCIGSQYECMACSEPYKGTSYDIYVHFKQKHEDVFLMNNPEFIVAIDNELFKTYLYCKNDLLFFINVQYIRTDQELILNVSHLGSDQQSSLISQKFTLYSVDRKVKHQTKTKSCCSVSQGNLKSFRVSISENDFPQNVVICRFNLNTENVEHLISLPEKFEKGKSLTQLDLGIEPTENSGNVFSQPTEYYPSNPSDSGHKKYPVRLKKDIYKYNRSAKDPVAEASSLASLGFATSGFSSNASNCLSLSKTSDTRLGSAKDLGVGASFPASPVKPVIGVPSGIIYNGLPIMPPPRGPRGGDSVQHRS